MHHSSCDGKTKLSSHRACFKCSSGLVPSSQNSTLSDISFAFVGGTYIHYDLKLLIYFYWLKIFKNPVFLAQWLSKTDRTNTNCAVI